MATETCRIESYVDDCKILLSFSIKDSTSAKQNIEKDLLRVAAWCCTNNLLINADKTKFLLIGTRQMLQKLPEDMSLFFLGKLITPVTTAKDLGETLDCNLTYDDPINKLTASCMSKLRQINRVKNRFDSNTLQLIIPALVMSKLFCCSTRSGLTQLTATSRNFKVYRTLPVEL